MKIVLATSDITYCPGNYDQVLEGVLERSHDHVAGVIIIKIDYWSILSKPPYLYLAGCKNLANTLRANLALARKKSKEKLCKKHSIPYIVSGNINTENIIAWCAEKEIDLIFNMRTRCIYKKAILDIPKLGCINIHHGILPEQRGLYCNLYALADNKETGVSIHRIIKKIDTGPIFYKEKIESDKNYMNFLDKSSEIESRIISNFIENTAKNNSLPESVSNECDSPILTTTPHYKEIKQLKRKGMIL